MRLLVYPHELSIGGSQINAIDVAAGIAQAGHEAIVYGVPGPLVPYVEARGLRFLPARRLRYRPGPSRALQLAAIARRERIDLIHAYEWPPCLDAALGAGFLGVPLLCTVLSMSVSPYVPASTPLVMGTEQLTVEARALHRATVWTIEPPIDVGNDHPGIDGAPFRRSHGVADAELLVVSVSRLAVDLKLDALGQAIDAVDLLADRHPVRLVLVGDGPARPALQARAAEVNGRHRREVVSLPGAVLDPRQAYAAADVVVAMGSSALRALAIGRAVVVQGEQGFSEIFEPTSLALFLHQGFYGLGAGGRGGERLASQLDALFRAPERRRELGAFGHRIVNERFSIDRAVRRYLEIMEEVLRQPKRRSVADVTRATARAIWLEIQNHDPRRKSEQRAREHALLAAAGRAPDPSLASRSADRPLAALRP